jgi:hypothetical protein
MSFRSSATQRKIRCLSKLQGPVSSCALADPTPASVNTSIGGDTDRRATRPMETKQTTRIESWHAHACRDLAPAQYLSRTICHSANEQLFGEKQQRNHIQREHGDNEQDNGPVLAQKLESAHGPPKTGGRHGVITYRLLRRFDTVRDRGHRTDWENLIESGQFPTRTLLHRGRLCPHHPPSVDGLFRFLLLST